jgi:hypothetical protein
VSAALARVHDRWHHPLHLKILDDADFIKGNFATDFLTRYEYVAESAWAAGR